MGKKKCLSEILDPKCLSFINIENKTWKTEYVLVDKLKGTYACSMRC